MAFQDITLPLDCTPIGLNFILTSGTVAELDNQAFLTNVMRVPDADNRLQAARPVNDLIFIAQTDTVVSNITINGENYRVIGHAGNGGYGATCIVAKDNPDGTESRFVLKEQTSSHYTDDLRVIKEAIINFALNKATVGYPFFPTIYSVFYSTRNSQPRLYCLIDLLAIDGQKLINSAPDPDSKSTVIFWLFSHLIDRLQELYIKFAYNHGDLKPANVMVDHGNNLRLIDFGMSRMELVDSSGPVTLQLSEFNTQSSNTKDLTLMAILTNYSFKGFINPACTTFLDTIDNGFNCTTNVWVSSVAAPLSAAMTTAIKCGGKVLRNISDIYKYNNTTINPTGSFPTVRASCPPVPTLNFQQMGLMFIPLTAPQGPRPIVAVLPLSPVVSMPGGAKLRRKTKSKRLYRKYAARKSRKL